MKTLLLVLAGTAVITAVAVAKRHGIDQSTLIRIPTVVRHQYTPLTPAQKSAAVQLFKLKLAPSGGTPATYTLTAQSPYSSPLGASLAAMGYWYSSSSTNQVLMLNPTQ